MEDENAALRREEQEAKEELARRNKGKTDRCSEDRKEKKSKKKKKKKKKAKGIKSSAGKKPLLEVYGQIGLDPKPTVKKNGDEKSKEDKEETQERKEEGFQLLSIQREYLKHFDGDGGLRTLRGPTREPTNLEKGSRGPGHNYPFGGTTKPPYKIGGATRPQLQHHPAHHDAILQEHADAPHSRCLTTGQCWSIS